MNIPGAVRGNIQGWAFRDESLGMNTQGALRKHSGSRSGTFREHWGTIEGTFREHSGNIQGRFREHSGNIHGTFTEHSDNIQCELSGRPWAPLPNARSTYKKYQGDPQNTSCPHQYLRRGLTRPSDEQEYNSVFTTCYHAARAIPPSREHSDNIEGTLREQ
jgi:hypothetical protein